MIGDQNKNTIQSEDPDGAPAIPRIPPLIALSAKIFNERITVKFTRNNFQVDKKPHYSSCVVTKKPDHRFVSDGEGIAYSDTENTHSDHGYSLEEMPPRSGTPSFNPYDSSNSPGSPETENMPKQKKFVCDFCPKSYSKLKRFEKHKKRHHNRQLFGCKYCDQSFSSLAAWDYHVKAIHKNQRDFICEECDTGFVTKHHLQAHLKRHKYTCHFCMKTFTARYKLNRHKEIHRTFQCYVCAKAFFREHRLQRHIELKHSDAEQTSQQNDEPMCQEPVYQNEDPEEPVCREEEPVSQEREEPVSQEREEPVSQEPEEPVYQKLEEPVSQKLEEPVSQKLEEPVSQELEEPVSQEDSSPKQPTKQIPTPCKYCSKIFPSMEDLQRHWKVTGDNLLICVHCFEIYDDQLAFSLHLLTHSEEKIFMCTLCLKTFATMDLLENHFSTHSGLSIQ